MAYKYLYCFTICFNVNFSVNVLFYLHCCNAGYNTVALIRKLGLTVVESCTVCISGAQNMRYLDFSLTCWSVHSMEMSDSINIDYWYLDFLFCLRLYRTLLHCTTLVENITAKKRNKRYDAVYKDIFAPFWFCSFRPCCCQRAKTERIQDNFYYCVYKKACL